MSNKEQAHQFGELIGREKADRIIEKRIKIKARVNKFLVPLLEYPNDLTQSLGKKPSVLNEQEDLPYFDNEYNGFVFSKSLIDELFSAQATSNGPLDSLVIVLAAEKDVETDLMSPTVLIAACTSVKINNDEFYLVTPDGLTPGGETPPKKILTRLPSSIPFKDNIKPGENAMVFSIK